MKKIKLLNFLFVLIVSFILIPNIVLAAENENGNKFAEFPEDELIYDNFNIRGVSSGPSQDVIITLLDTQTKIDAILTYHYRASQESAEGATISLVNVDTNVIYGPWNVVSDPWYWYVFPTENNILPAGEYKVVDSKRESWSCNGESGYKGFTKIKGVPVIPHSLTEVPEKDATCTEDGNVHHWHCSVCNKNYTDETAATEIEDVVIPALNHDWNEVEYSWSEDGKTAFAIRVCKRDSNHKERATTTNITSEQTKAPTIEAKGETTYTATFTESWAGTTKRVLEDIPKLVEQVENETLVNNPQTLDNIMIYVIALVLSVVGIIASIIYVKKKK